MNKNINTLQSQNDRLEKENNNLKEALKYAARCNVIYGYGISALIILIFGIGIYLT